MRQQLATWQKVRLDTDAYNPFPNCVIEAKWTSNHV